MGNYVVSGNTIFINNEVNLLGANIKVRCTTKKDYPVLSKPTQDISKGFSAMLPAFMGGIPTSSGLESYSEFMLAAMSSICTAGRIKVEYNNENKQYVASYINTVTRVTKGAYSKNNQINRIDAKNKIMAIMDDIMNKSGPAFSSWTEVLIDFMQNATLQDFMKGIQSAICAMVQDPVNANTGNYIYQKEDLSVKGKIPLHFKRSYNRIDTRTGSMGRGWRHNYEIRLLVEEDRYIILWEDGREELYLRDEDNTPIPLFGGFCRLKPDGNGYLYETQEKRIYAFDTRGNLLNQKDQNGQGLQFLYDKSGRLSSVGNGYGSSLSYQYDSNSGLLTKVTDHCGRTVNLTYELGRLKEVKDPIGAKYQYFYDSGKTIYQLRDPRGVYILKNIYDPQGRTIQQTLTDGGEINYDYQKELSRTLVTEQNGNRVSYVHDERFRNVKTTYIDGEETFSYNNRNQLIQKIDKNGNKTKYSYDDRGNTCQIVYPDGEKHNMTYDVNNRLLVMSVNGTVKLKNTYDGKGNLIKATDALGYCREIEYDEIGQPIKLIQPDGSTRLFEYDNRGNMSKMTDTLGNSVVIEYDTCNRVSGTTDGNGNRTRFSYDENDRITCVTNAAGKQLTYEYSKTGKLTKITDFNGAVTVQEYNSMDQVKSVHRPDGEILRIEYDLMHNIVRKILPNGGEVSFAYDRLNRLEAKTLPTVGTIRYEYDPNGNRIATIAPDGKRTSMEYDERNRLIKLTEPGGAAAEYGYDMEGHLVNITNDAGKSYTCVYNEAGRLIRETDLLGNVNTYEYNSLGLLSCFIDPQKKKTTYEYNTNGFLSKITYPDDRFEVCHYDKHGNMIRCENQKGDYLEFTYDCLNQLVKAKSSFGQEEIYTYNAFGKVTSVTDTTGHVSKKPDSDVEAAIKIEHLAGFFQDKKENWANYGWEDDTVRYIKLKNPNIFDHMDMMNKTLYKDEVYELEDSPDISGQVIMNLFNQQSSPWETVRNRMSRKEFDNTVIPDWNMINIRNAFRNTSFNVGGLDDSMLTLIDKYEKHPLINK